MDITNLILEYIRPELIILIPVLWLVGSAFKKAQAVPDKLIPVLLGIVSVVLVLVYILATSEAPVSWQSVPMGFFVALTQGVLCAGAAVYADQIIKQLKKDE